MQLQYCCGNLGRPCEGLQAKWQTPLEKNPSCRLYQRTSSRTPRLTISNPPRLWPVRSEHPCKRNSLTNVLSPSNLLSLCVPLGDQIGDMRWATTPSPQLPKPLLQFSKDRLRARLGAEYLSRVPGTECATNMRQKLKMEACTPTLPLPTITDLPKQKVQWAQRAKGFWGYVDFGCLVVWFRTSDAPFCGTRAHCVEYRVSV
jgi:hypothetical protein